jgi:hypothetical protein
VSAADEIIKQLAAMPTPVQSASNKPRAIMD